MTAAPVPGNITLEVTLDVGHLRDLPAAERDSALAALSATLEGKTADEIAAIGNFDPYSQAPRARSEPGPPEVATTWSPATPDDIPLRRR